MKFDLMQRIKKSWLVMLAFGAVFPSIFWACADAPKSSKQHKETVPVAEEVQSEPQALETELPDVEQEKGEEIVLNPPHGEPGHRCEIPVGSPLNGPEVTESAVAGTAPAQVEAPKTYSSMAPTIENARRLNAGQARQNTAPQTGEKPALNPPHGQPWHRCDIAVGAPLP